MALFIKNTDFSHADSIGFSFIFLGDACFFDLHYVSKGIKNAWKFNVQDEERPN